MAYRKSNGKLQRKKKMQPAVMQIELQVPTGFSYVDLNLCASLLNRRGYKQENTNWAVSGFEFLSNAATSGVVSIAKLPETWVMQNAYTKSRALWDKMNDQVLDDEPSIQGTYADFKVYLDDDMRQQTIQDQSNLGGKILTPFVGNFTAGDFSGAAPPRTNWDWSKIQVPNDGAPGTTTEYLLHMIGPDSAASKGVIAGYALSRSRPQLEDPNVPTTEGWMNEMFDVGDNNEEIRDDIVSDNDRPPYPVVTGVTEYYPGGSQEYAGVQIHGFCNFTSTTVSSKNSIQGGMFALGMFAISNNTDQTLNLLIHLVPGSHRGYLVEELC